MTHLPMQKRLRSQHVLFVVAFASLLFAFSVSTGTADAATKAAKSAKSAKSSPKIVPPKIVTYVPADYPPELKEQALAGTVILQLDLKVDGTVGKAEVAKSAGPIFDAAALDAGKKLVFTPATADGKAIPVRINFRYVFKMQIAVTRRGRALGLGRYQRRSPVTAPAGFASLSGVILERGTGRPVAGAIVLVPKLKKEAITDVDGQFRFGVLPPGKYLVQAQSAEHRKVKGRIEITMGKATTWTPRLQRISYVLYRATAEAPPQPGEIARRSIRAEEIQRIPGVYGDAFKVVQNLPGVARAPAISGQIIVRGSSPADTQVLIDGVRVPLLYHFGNLYSVVNTDILESIDFTPGGAPVRYGRKTGGLLQAQLKLPRTNEEWHGYVETNVFHTGAFLRGPLSEDTTLTLSARRSYIDVVLATVVPDGALPFTLAPRYWDYQAKLDHRFSDKLDATLLLLGSDDTLTLVTSDPPPGFPDSSGELSSTTGFHGAIGVLRGRGKGWKTRSTLGVVRTGINFKVGDGTNLSVDISSWELTFRQDVEVGTGPVKLRAGLDVFDNEYDVNFLFPSQFAQAGAGAGAQSLDRALSVTTGIFAPALWVDAVYRTVPNLEVVPGVRVDLYTRAGNGATALPKLNARYKVDEFTTIKGAVGMLSQVPEPQQLSERFGNTELQPIRSFEAALGAEYKPFPRLNIDVQAFFKDIWDIPVAPDQVIPEVALINERTGLVYGVELLIRHPPVGRFFGWIAYTLSRSTRTDHPGDTERLFQFDQTHILTALGSYKLPNDFEISARFRYVTGNPYTGISTAIWRNDNDSWQRINSACLYCERYPAFHQLDLRADKKFVFDRWMLSVYLDVQNVYNRSNPESIQWNYDSTVKQFQSLLPIIPSLGIKGEF